MKKPFLFLVATAMLAVVSAMLAPCAVTVRWSGSTELTIEFVVSDSATGIPIENAEIRVYDDGERVFVLRTNAHGLARHECRDCMCAGTDKLCGLISSRSVYVPFWMLRIKADGYESSAEIELSTPDRRRAVQRLGPQKDRLVVPLKLSKKNPP